MYTIKIDNKYYNKAKPGKDYIADEKLVTWKIYVKHRQKTCNSD